MNFKNRAKLKAALLSAAAIATSCLIGMSAACTTKTPEEEENNNAVTKQDTQIIKNGNFEFYNDNDGLYPISNPDNWTSNYNGNASVSMGGIINTSKKSWDYLTDKTLPETLKTNNDLASDNEDKKDYNGVLQDDLPYVNPHTALNSDAKDEEKVYIDNPFTHNYKYDSEGKVTDADGKVVEVFTSTAEDKKDKVYIDEACTQELETSVLMLHNYRGSYYSGAETYFTSSSTVTLAARTAAKISVWVKTAELTFDGAKNTRTEVENEHGAYIQVKTAVGGNSLDDFFIRNIDTQKQNPDAGNNGWVQYSVYVQASSFAETTVSLALGLGENDKYTVEGYAFFDDIQIEKYENESEMIAAADKELGEGGFSTVVGKEKSTANLLSPEHTSTFRVDKYTVKTNDSEGNLIDKLFDNNFGDTNFYIDLASTHETKSLILNASSVNAGFTVEKTSTGKYVSAKNGIDGSYTTYAVGTLDNGAANAFLPANTKSRKVNNDILATVNVSDADDWAFSLPNSTNDKYNSILTQALSSCVKLPGADSSNTSAMVLLSGNGAAYEAEIYNDNIFTLNKDEKALVTFWLKTSDMNGKTAATVTVKDIEEKTTATLTLDTTTVSTVDINDKEDIYDGWVECFIRVQNTSETDNRKFKLTVNFGNTTIKGTSETSYTGGWLAVTNISFMKLDDDVYNYLEEVSNSMSLTLSDTAGSTGNRFDTEQGDKNVIKNDLAIPANYTGVNGASAEVSSIKVTPTAYDETNKNKFAGILNKDNIERYMENAKTGNGCDWYNAIEALKNLVAVDAETVWQTLAGRYSVQPLLIVNTVREFADKSGVYNYGYIGGNTSVSANGYTAVSVRVKASQGAIANVYLVDSTTKKPIGFSTPAYTFWYDDDGNILKGEPKEKPSIADLKANIAYNLRDDGLYEKAEGKDGKVYANFYNLEKYYDYDMEDEAFYDANGPVKFEDLVQGNDYYADAACTTPSAHYLAATGNKKVYKFKAVENGAPTYYYMVEGKADTSKVVYGIDTSVATLRYDATDENENNIPYRFTIDTTTEEGAKYADKWVTVTFYIHAGSNAQNYKLELWSGERDKETSGQAEGSYVMFDYNSISLSESSYNELVSYYTDGIIAEYKDGLSDEQDKNYTSIADYEKNGKNGIYNYTAKYYTYTLYDSATYVPFNAETAEENETGYAYSYSDYDEGLVYLSVEDSIGDEFTMSAFVDYSSLEKDISLSTSNSTDHDHDDDSDSSTTRDSNFWLLLASIILIAAILLAMIAIFLKDLIKKLRRNAKSSGKNTYNFNKNKRYVRKYVKANGEVKPVEEGALDESLLTDKEPEAPAEENATEETPAEEALEETPVEEAEAEETPVEETPAEEPAKENTPAEEPTEKNDGDENKE